MKISFILPVYKVEAYLRECVNSLTCQTYKDIEIILVDDGSPDGCPALCDQLATEDSRIIVLHKLNGGLSDARNAGLKIATGDYVVFVDSDDFWRHDDDLQKLVLIAEKHANMDFIGYNCQYYYDNKQTFSSWVAYSDVLNSPVTGDKAIQLLVCSGTFPMSACMKMIRRSHLINNCITFKKGQLHEDIPWFINLLEKTQNCIFINEYVYVYRQNVSGSITNTVSERSFNCLLNIIQEELSLVDKRKFSSESKDALKSFLAYELCILMMLVDEMPEEQKKVYREDLKKLTWLLKYTENPKVRIVAILYKFLGFLVTEKMLRVYNWYRLQKR